jgi:hypothetical protein
MKTELAVAADVKRLYAPGLQPTIVDVPAFKFLMVDGKGNPNTSAEFHGAIQALYGLTYAIHFALREKGLESRIRPLEALWWAAGGADFARVAAAGWRWTAMIMQPDELTPTLFDKVREETRRKKPNPMLDKVRLETFEEGMSAQVMHIGPYSAEKPTIDALHAFISEEGFRLRGKHHEIYMGDPRRAAPEKLKTIIRQPISR